MEALELSGEGNTLRATVRTRGRLPAHTLTGYRLRWVVYAAQGYPVEQHEADLPTMAPGSATTIDLGIKQPLPSRVQRGRRAAHRVLGAFGNLDGVR